MKKILFALVALVFSVNINAATTTKAASERIVELRAEQTNLQDKAMASDPITAMQIMKGVITLDKEIEELIPALLSERETLRNQALNCGNDVVGAMKITKRVIFIDNLLDELGYEEPCDDDCVE